MISYFSQTFEKVHAITVDNNAIFLFVTPIGDSKLKVPEQRRDIIKLTEITVAEKINILLKKCMFDQADKIAIEYNCSSEIRARIAKE